MPESANGLPFQLETRQRLGEPLYRYMMGQPADALLDAVRRQQSGPATLSPAAPRDARQHRH